MKTTLNKIREHQPCADGWKRLLTYLGKNEADDEELSVLTILDSNGFGDVLWCLRAVENEEKKIRLYAVWCARQIQHLMLDQRTINALDVAERFANGEATRDELHNACAAATEAYAYAATDAYADAVAYAAARAASAAYACHAARAAADLAAMYAVYAVCADIRSKQETEFRRICSEEN